MSAKHSQVLIIGSGPAGLTAAIYASRGSLQTTILAGPEPGGQLTLTTEVEDFPGFPEGILGPELMERMRKQAERFGVSVLSESVVSCDLTKQPFVLKTEEAEYTADCVIIATGASARWLGLPSEQKLIGHGVSSCAVCDGFFFKGQDVVVVGGGDSAMKEALYLAKLCKSVTLVHRRSELRAQKIQQDRAHATPNINWRLGYEVEEVLGEGKVSGLRLKNIVTNEVEELACTGLFVAIGHIPNTKPFADQLKLTVGGYIDSPDGVNTSIPGVYVAGDAQDQKYRQAVTAAGMGCAAAFEAEEWIAKLADNLKTT